PIDGMKTVRRSPSSRVHQHQATADILIAARGCSGVPIRGAAITRPIPPRAAAQDARGGLAASQPLRVDHLGLRILAVPILAPFPHIAVHVRDTPQVWREMADGRSRHPRDMSLTAIIGN